MLETLAIHKALKGKKKEHYNDDNNDDNMPLAVAIILLLFFVFSGYNAYHCGPEKGSVLRAILGFFFSIFYWVLRGFGALKCK